MQGVELDGAELTEPGDSGPREPEGDRETIRRVLDDAAAALDALAHEYDGAFVERKPTAVAFHYRRIAPSRRNEAAGRAGSLVQGSELLRIQPGHMVVELVSGRANKGEALDTLRSAIRATATVFVGDDRTDEHAFARLGPGDLAVKIGPGETCARLRIASQTDVAPLFRRLQVLRAARAIATP
jgi:trehalose-phosphatase